MSYLDTAQLSFRLNFKELSALTKRSLLTKAVIDDLIGSQFVLP